MVPVGVIVDEKVLNQNEGSYQRIKTQTIGISNIGQDSIVFPFHTRMATFQPKVSCALLNIKLSLTISITTASRLFGAAAGFDGGQVINSNSASNLFVQAYLQSTATSTNDAPVSVRDQVAFNYPFTHKLNSQDCFAVYVTGVSPGTDDAVFGNATFTYVYLNP